MTSTPARTVVAVRPMEAINCRRKIIESKIGGYGWTPLMGSICDLFHTMYMTTNVMLKVPHISNIAFDELSERGCQG